MGKNSRKRGYFNFESEELKKGNLYKQMDLPMLGLRIGDRKCSLPHCVDDATGKIQAAIFAPSETIWGYFELMQIYLQVHGRPKAFYNDKHAVFRVNRPGALSGTGLTQFGRAIKALDIEMIYAN